MSNREEIPEPLKRKVRQRFRFKCVICNKPIYEIHHVIEYAIVKKHELVNLVLLCPDHHDKFHRGLIDIDYINNKIESFDKVTWTEKDEVIVKPHLITIGNNKLFGFNEFAKSTVILILDQLYLGINLTDNGDYLINFVAKYESKEVFKIINNELIINTESWDVEIIKNKYTIRNNPRDIILSLTLDALTGIQLLGKFNVGLARLINITKDGIFYGNSPLIVDSIIKSCRNGLVILNKPIKGGAGFHSSPTAKQYNIGGQAVNCDIGFYNSNLNFQCTVNRCDVGMFWELESLKNMD